MKNVNIFVDVDLTLIDAEGRLFENAREGLEHLKNRGCQLYLWSSNGQDYARKAAECNGLAHLFDGFAAKPDIIIDDMPKTATDPFVFDVNNEESWPALARRIVDKHVD